MTVSELIELLEKVEDKKQKIAIVCDRWVNTEPEIKEELLYNEKYLVIE